MKEQDLIYIINHYCRIHFGVENYCDLNQGQSISLIDWMIGHFSDEELPTKTHTKTVVISPKECSKK